MNHSLFRITINSFIRSISFPLNQKYYFCSEPQPLKFQQLLSIRSTQSLTQAARLMAQLQIQIQSVYKNISDVETQISLYSQSNQLLVDKIKNLEENVKMQIDQNQAIIKRAEKQVQDTKKYAISKLAKQILQVSDNIDRSINHSQKICKQTQQKLKYFKKYINKLFLQYGIIQFNPIGKQYDPNTQESLLKIQLPKQFNEEQKIINSNKVVECSRTGYMIKGRLLRSAHVCVYQ